MEPLKNWDVFMMADIYMDRIFSSGAVSKHPKNSADVVVSRFVCLYDEPICNASTSTCKMYRVQSNDIPYPAIRHGNLSRILWQCQFIFIFKDFAIFDMPACEAKVSKTLDIYNVLLKQKNPIDWYIIGAQV